MRISAKADYAVRAVIELAAAPERASLSAREIATAQEIPQNFLENILAELRRGGHRAHPSGSRRWLEPGPPGRRRSRWGRSSSPSTARSPRYVISRPTALVYPGTRSPPPGGVAASVEACLHEVLDGVTVADLAADEHQSPKYDLVDRLLGATVPSCAARCLCHERPVGRALASVVRRALSPRLTPQTSSASPAASSPAGAHSPRCSRARRTARWPPTVALRPFESPEHPWTSPPPLDPDAPRPGPALAAALLGIVARARGRARPLAHARRAPTRRALVRPRRGRRTTHDVWLIGWDSFQGVELHDHGGAAGVLYVVDGKLQETSAPAADPGATRPSRRCRAGTARAFGARPRAPVVNPSARPATSLHVYSPPSVTMDVLSSGRGRRARAPAHRGGPCAASGPAELR